MKRNTRIYNEFITGMRLEMRNVFISRSPASFLYFYLYYNKYYY